MKKIQGRFSSLASLQGKSEYVCAKCQAETGKDNYHIRDGKRVYLCDECRQKMRGNYLTKKKPTV